MLEKAPEEIAAVSAAAPVQDPGAPEVEPPAAESAIESTPTSEEVQAEVVAKAPEEIAAVTAEPASETAAPAPAEEAGS